MNILLLGAGHIGLHIARLLRESGTYRVLVADRSETALTRAAALGLATRRIDGAGSAALREPARGCNALINALPYHCAVDAASAARQLGLHYFDLTEDVAATQAIRALAADADTAFMPQCGLAPGFVGIAAHALAQRFEHVVDLKLRVGALPQFPTNALKYNLTWSLDGLINEYCHPCAAVRAGQPQLLQPLEDLEHFSIDGVEYEAFNTSGGLGTLCETLAGRVDNLDYKTVRYPGHLALMRFLLQDLRLTETPATLKTILQHGVPATRQDVVLVFVTASGRRDGILVQEVFSRKLFARGGVSAIQAATATGICAAVDLFREGRLPRRGFVAPERIALEDFLQNRFGRIYAADDTPPLARSA